ncbi:MAG: hypothetical protein LQ339_004216 [Xanthoria mediterranea]|nr:MAG: hypothetical protein LQ339_004216 [Xanthoria mediterranea]
MRFGSHQPSHASFANVLTETNRTVAKMQKRHATPQQQAKMVADLAFFLQYLIVLFAVVILFMLWHDYMPSWEDYAAGSRARGHNGEDWAYDYEEWLQRQEDAADETTPLIRRREEGPLSPGEVHRLSSILNDETEKLLRSIKEEPLSSEEIARLTELIRADADTQFDYGSIQSRKRQAIDDSDDDSSDEWSEQPIETHPGVGLTNKLVRADADNQSDHGSMASRKRKAVDRSDDSGDEWLGKPRARKLKIETDAGVNAKWVCGEFTRSPGVLSERGSYNGYSADCEIPFTFRAPHPGRKIKSPVKQRK